MKSLFLVGSILALTASAFGCPNLEGKYQLIACIGNEPSTVLHIPIANVSLNRQTDQDILVIKQNACDYDFTYNDKSQGAFSKKDHSNWMKPYEQSRNLYKVDFSDNSKLVLNSKPTFNNAFVDATKIKIVFTKNHDGELIISKKTADKWFLGVWPVIDHWKAKCQLVPIR
jgi:hypothetical protein